MIEIWRQCVHRSGGSEFGIGTAFLAAGPLRGEGVLREVRVLITSSGRAASRFALVLAGTPAEDLDSFRAAAPLMVGPSNVEMVGKPGWYEGVETTFYGQRVFPFYLRMESGARWVSLAWSRNAGYDIYVVLSITVVGYAKIGANGLGVEDGLDR